MVHRSTCYIRRVELVKNEACITQEEKDFLKELYTRGRGGECRLCEPPKRFDKLLDHVKSQHKAQYDDITTRVREADEKFKDEIDWYPIGLKKLGAKRSRKQFQSDLPEDKD